METKVCAQCKMEKPVDQFHRNRASKSGRRARCKPCSSIERKVKYWADVEQERLKQRKKYAAVEKTRRRQQHRLKTYGLTPEEYDRRFRDQRGLCALCQKRKPQVVDHHEPTQIVRGLLCHKCNIALGLLEEDPEVIVRVLPYLDQTYGYPIFPE